MQSLSGICYANNQKRTEVGPIVQAISSIAHVCMLLIYTKFFNMGFTGVCIANLMMYILRFLLTLLFIDKIYDNLSNVYNVKLFSNESTQNFQRQFKTGLMGLLMGVWSWW